MKKILLPVMAFLLTVPVFAEDGAAETTRDSSFWQTIIMIAIAIVFFYFILWRPEQKRRKAMETQRSSMKKGDRVTAMGIVGTVDRIKETTVILKMVDGAKIEVLKAAISDVKSESSVLEEEKKESEETPKT
jgi:preprotein translocase subunit YajC